MNKHTDPDADSGAEDALKGVLSSCLKRIQAQTSFDAPSKYSTMIAAETIHFHAITQMTLKLDLSRIEKANHNEGSLKTLDAEAQIRREFERRSEFDWVRQAVGIRTEDEAVTEPITKRCCETCKTCEGSASVTCAGCRGHRQINCAAYGCSNGQVKCGDCQNGKRKCIQCYASGFVDKSIDVKVDTGNGGFHYVSQKTRVYCPDCSGTRYAGQCWKCMGSSNVSCGTCNGHAKVTCPNCNGKGTCTCSDCRSGTRYITLTGLPVVDRTTVRQTESQDRLDQIVATIPNVLKNKAAKQANNIIVRRNGLLGVLEYDAKVHVALIENEHEILAGTGTVDDKLYVSKAMRIEATGPVAATIMDDDVEGLSKTELGKAVLDQIKNPDLQKCRLGTLAFYDVDDKLLLAADTFRKTFSRMVNRGTRGARWIIFALALLLPFAAYEIHFLQLMLEAGVTNWRIVFGATFAFPFLLAALYGSYFLRRRRKMLKQLGIGKVTLPALKIGKVFSLSILTTLASHFLIIALPMHQLSTQARASGIPVNFVSICGDEKRFLPRAFCAAETMVRVFVEEPLEEIPLHEFVGLGLAQN